MSVRTQIFKLIPESLVLKTARKHEPGYFAAEPQTVVMVYNYIYIAGHLYEKLLLF